MYEEDKDLSEEELLSPIGDDAFEDDDLIDGEDAAIIDDEEPAEDEAY